MRRSLFLPLLPALLLQAQEPFDRLTFHAVPSPLADNATCSDWPAFLGPSNDASSPEQPLQKTFPEGGPRLLWRVNTGEGYTSPAIVGDRLLLFHALDGRETIECLHPETGRRYWSFDYPIQYQDRYGFGNGPRGSPTVADGVVVTLGVTSMLHGLDLATGKLLWSRDLRAEYHVPQDFFGHGSSPLIANGRVFVQVGGKTEPFDGFEDRRERARKLATRGVSVAAFDLKTGAVLWQAEDEWGASYASPVLTELHGKTKLLVFAGGESDPPTGGLLCLDPASGKVHHRFPWRADDYISATASNPVVIPGKNRVFLTTCYPKGRPLGGVMVEFDASFQAREIWRSTKIGVHWMTPIHHEGHLYAIDGERENNSRFVCVDAETGTEVWSRTLEWEDNAFAPSARRSRPMRLSALRSSLLRCGDDFLCLGEVGSLHWLKLSPAGLEEHARAQLFYALHTWSLPAISRGLLYVRQQAPSLDGGSGPALLCYDLRGGH
jgi:outer membrane protein assembly factor BamB